MAYLFVTINPCKWLIDVEMACDILPLKLDMGNTAAACLKTWSSPAPLIAFNVLMTPSTILFGTFSTEAK